MANINTTHENDVIFNMDSLREFIKLIKKQGAENIDFYAVSELLQPPGENVTTIALTGSKDENLQPWIDLYNNTRRQEMEENNILQNFQQLNGNKYQRTESVRNLQVEVWQYLPEQQKMDATVENGVITGTKIRVIQPAKFTQITNQDDITTQLCVMDGYVYDFNKGEYVETKRYAEVNYTGQQIFDTQFNLALEFQKITKPKNTEENPMNYYSNLENLLSDLTTKSVINIDGKDLYLNRPVMPTGNEIKVFFVLNANEKAKLINALSAYLDYNKQINKLQKEKPVSQYERKRIQNDDNEPWWKFIYVKYNGTSVYSIEGQEELEHYREFNEDELKNNPGKIVVVRKIYPWQQDKTTNNNSSNDINIKSGRHLYLQAGSLLKFNPGQSTEEAELIDDYWTDTTPGTFSIDENDGQKAHIITIRGFDQNGNFNNKNPIVGYVNQNNIPENQNNDGIYKINDKNYNLTPEQLANLASEFDILPVYNLDNEIVGYIKKTDVPQEPNSDGEYKIDGNKYNLKPVYNLNNELIGYIDYNDIPQDTNPNGNYKIGENTYALDSNQIIQLFFPVYLNNNNSSMTSHEGNFDIVKFKNLEPTGGGGGTKTKFLRDDGIWANELEGPLTLYNYLKLRARNNTDQYTHLRYEYGNGTYGNYLWFSNSETSTTGSTGQNFWAAKVFNAVFNDYAECRKTINLKSGKVVIDNDDGSLSCTTQRLQPGAQIISDTFGHLMGYDETHKTPIAVAGRVLAYTYQPRENYHAGMAVCSAPNGTVDIMTREEIKEYPDCIIGIVSEIPNYEKWGTDQVEVNGRIWIKVK